MNPAQCLEETAIELRQALEARDKAERKRSKAICRYRAWRCKADEALVAYLAGEAQWSAVVEARAKRNKAAGDWGRTLAETAETGTAWWNSQKAHRRAVKAHERYLRRAGGEA